MSRDSDSKWLDLYSLNDRALIDSIVSVYFIARLLDNSVNGRRGRTTMNLALILT